MRFLLAALLAVTLAVPAFATESVEGYTETAAPVVDASGAVWTFGAANGSDFALLKNGVQWQGGYGKKYVYHNHTIFAQAADGSWWSTNGTSGWTAASDPTRCARSANAATVTSTSGNICDASGNVWTLTNGNGLQVTKNGTQQGTAQVVLMYYDNPNDRVYQENNQAGWWYTAAAGAVSWVATTDPRQSANCAGTDWCDDFTSLDIGQHMDPAHKWSYVDTWGPAWDGEAINSTWETNPLNPATAISGIYGTSGGNLTLNILATPGTCTSACGGKNNVAASMWSTTTPVFHGYTECRMKLLPNLNNSTFACWLYGNKSGPSAAYQELDIIESPRAGDGSWNLIAQTIHRGNVAGGQPGTDLGDPTPYYRWSSSFDGNFHTYGVDWSDTQICYYIDRVQTQCEATPAGYDSPMWVSIGLGDSGSWGGGAINPASLPAQGQVDYVAHWAARPF